MVWWCFWTFRWASCWSALAITGAVAFPGGRISRWPNCLMSASRFTPAMRMLWYRERGCRRRRFARLWLKHWVRNRKLQGKGGAFVGEGLDRNLTPVFLYHRFDKGQAQPCAKGSFQLTAFLAMIAIKQKGQFLWLYAGPLIRNRQAGEMGRAVNMDTHGCIFGAVLHRIRQ